MTGVQTCALPICDAKGNRFGSNPKFAFRVRVNFAHAAYDLLRTDTAWIRGADGSWSAGTPTAQ